MHKYAIVTLEDGIADVLYQSSGVDTHIFDLDLAADDPEHSVDLALRALDLSQTLPGPGAHRLRTTAADLLQDTSRTEVAETCRTLDRDPQPLLDLLNSPPTPGQEEEEGSAVSRPSDEQVEAELRVVLIAAAERAAQLTEDADEVEGYNDHEAASHLRHEAEDVTTALDTIFAYLDR